MTRGTCSGSGKSVGRARRDAFTVRGKLIAVASETKIGCSKTCTTLRGASCANGENEYKGLKRELTSTGQIVLGRKEGPRWATFNA